VFAAAATRLRLPALVALVAMAAHATALGGGFVWLDHAHLEEGLALAPPGDLLSLFTRGFAGTGFYRPLVSISLSAVATLSGAAWLYHALAWAWHAAAAALTVVAAQAMGLSRRAAVIAGVIVAVHPITSLVASAIAFQSESMMAVALLALVILHLRARPWGAALALAGGALTKETALVLGPLFIVALELFPPPGRPPDVGDRQSSDRRRRLLAAEAAALAVALVLRLLFAPPWRASAPSLSLSEGAGTRLAALGKSTGALLWPLDRTICDAFAVSSLASGRSLLGALVLLALVALAWKRRGPALLLALSVLPALQLVPVMRWWSPHYLYIPLIFAAMLAASAIPQGRAPVIAATVLAAAAAVVVARDDLRFRSDQSLWSREVSAQPACREGHFYLAEAAREAQLPDRAAQHYQQAIAEDAGIISYVDRGAALQNLGVVQLEQRRFAEAATAFRAALQLAGNDRERRQLTHNLAAAELSVGHAAEAERLLAPETQRPDALRASLLLRARALEGLGRRQEAVELVQRLRR
jgi:tetratricopeptide (TPR) repeat protein